MRNESKVVGSGFPRSWIARSERATLVIVAGSRNSAGSIPRPSTNTVTIAGGSSRAAATAGATPMAAARSFATRSAPRSISSRDVSLPGTRIT